MRRGTEKESGQVGGSWCCEEAALNAALSVTGKAMEIASRSAGGAAATTSAVELPTRCDGMSRCSAALSGSSAVALVSVATFGSSNARSITRSPVVHRQMRRASHPMTRM